MNIVINADQANRKTRTGVEVFSFNLIKSLKKVSQKDKYSDIKFTLVSQHPLVDDMVDMPDNWHYEKVISGLTFGRIPLWTQVFLPFFLFTKKYDLYFTPGYFPPAMCPIKSVSVIHDIGFKKDRRLYTASDYIKQTIAFEVSKRKSSLLVTPSKTVMNDVLNRYPELNKKLHHIPIGVFLDEFELAGDRLENTKRKFSLPDKFLFYPGRITPKKNLLNFVKSFIYAKDSGLIPEDINLVISGLVYSKKYFDKISLIVSKRSDIIYLNHLSREDFVDIMHLSVAVALVSYEEGFGIPAIEAFACGKKVLLSDIDVFREVAGEYGVYVNPDDIKSIADGIVDVLAPDDGFSEKAREYVKKYNWNSVAEKYLELFISL